ncbi:MAG: hypothetical protein RXR51_00515 [Nitrososphaeria archaeon]
MVKNLRGLSKLNWTAEHAEILEEFTRRMKESYEVQVGKTFWITTSFNVNVDFIIGSAAFCFSNSRMGELKKRAIKYLGYHCFMLDPLQLNPYFIEKTRELIRSLKPRPLRITPISERNVPEKFPLYLENRIIEAAAETAKLPNQDINAGLITKIVERKIPQITKMHSAMDKLVLTDLGFSLVNVNENILDYKKASERLCKMMNVMKTLFGTEGPITVSNLFTLSAPNFIKNLLVLGGPRVKPGLIQIKSYMDFLENVQTFTEEMQSCNIFLDLDELKDEICSFKNKIILEKKFDWIKNFCLKFTV